MAATYTITPATTTVAGGDTATIAGPSGLAAAAAVSFGTVRALRLYGVDDLTLLVVVPPHSVGTVAVTVHAASDLTVTGGMTYTAGTGAVVDWPDLKTVRTLLRLQPDAVEDAVIDQARVAAIDYGNRKTNYRWPPGAQASWLQPMADAVHQAALLHSARLYRRRDSLDGALGWGDMGLVRVGRVDPDIDALYALVGPVVFG